MAGEITDPIIASIGEFGRWQLFIFMVVVVSKFPVGWHQLAHVFLAKKVDYHCINNATDPCSSDCADIVYDTSIFQNTIVTQWDLVCDKAFLTNLSQTIFMFGILVGNMVFGIWSDSQGRRAPLVFSQLMQLVAGVLNSMAPWYWLYCFFRFLLAMATGGSMVITFVLAMEIMGPSMREVMSIVYQLPFFFGHALVPVFSYFLRDWRWMQFALSIYSIIFVSYIWLIPESPRWLMTVGKLDESEKVLTKGATCNKMPTEGIRGNLEEAYKRKMAAESQKATKKGTLLDLFRYPTLRVRTICMSYNWFVCGLCYFGIAQYIGDVSGNVFMNFAFSGLVGVPGTLVSIPMNKYLGRRMSLLLANLVCGIGMLFIACLPPDAGAIVFLAALATFGMSISFPTVYLYGGEIFPTVVRNAGVGFLSMTARIGSMIAPFLSDAKQHMPVLPPLVFGIVPLVGACLVLLLPETKGLLLPETIEDGENFGKKKKEEK